MSTRLLGTADFMILDVKVYGRKVHIYYRAPDFVEVRRQITDMGNVDRAKDWATMIRRIRGV